MYNIALNLERNAKYRPNNLAIINNDDKINYQQLNSLVDKVAINLANLGIKPGQNILLSSPNELSFVVNYYAILKIGAVVVPINPQSKSEEIIYFLNNSDAIAFICHQGNNICPSGKYGYEAFRQVSSCKNFIIIDTDNKKALDNIHYYSDWLEDNNSYFHTIPRSIDDHCVILYTSGTTGKSKGAVLTHSNILCNAQACQSLTYLTGNDISIAALPLFHSFGQSVILNASILTGSAIVLISRFTPSNIITQICKHQVTHFSGVPTMYISILKYIEQSGSKFIDSMSKSIRVAISGGSSLPLEILHSFENKLNVPIIEGYGLSESSPVAAFNTLEYTRKPGSVGLPLPGIIMKVVDHYGQELSSGQRGELLIYGHNVMKEYYNNQEETNKTIKDGWLYTGDIAYFDNDGYLYIIDRLKDVIIRAGYNIYPREIEEVFMRNPYIQQVSVIGVPHHTLGEEVVAFIILKNNIKTDIGKRELFQWGKQFLCDYKLPRHIKLVESMPTTASGKIIKRLLRESFTKEQ